MKNFSIAARISFGFALLVLALIASTVMSLVGFSSIERTVNELTDHDLAFFNRMVDARYHAGNLRRYEKDYFINLGNASERKEYKQKWDTSLAETRKSLEAAAVNPLDAEAGSTLNTLKTQLGTYEQGFNTVTQQVEGGQVTDTAAANAAFTPYKDNIRSLETSLRGLTDRAQEAANQVDDQIGAAADRSRTLLITLGATMLVVAVLLSLAIIRSIRSPLGTLTATSNRLAETRDLTADIPEFGSNELGRVAGSLRSLVGTVRTLVHESHGSSARLVASADELSRVSENVSESAQVQSQAAVASASAIEQMTVSINVMASNMEGVEEQAHKAAAEAESGSQLAGQAANDIRRIAASINEAASTIERLNQSSGEIGTIVQVIREIADQTNLLALNAAIEAARAGEMGRGFAVVADEVRKLAERTSSATAEISGRIGAVQNDTQAAYQNMREAHDRIEAGVQGTSRVETALDQIRRYSELSLEKISEVGYAIREQSQASQSVAQNVQQIAEMTENTSAAVSSASALAQELKRLSADLDQHLNRFTV